MSHIWSSQVGAVSQHCSQGASPGTACTNTCSSEEKDTSSCLFTNTGTQFQTHAHTCSHFLWPCTVAAWEVERLTHPYSFSLTNLSGSFMVRIVNGLTPNLEPWTRCSVQERAPLPRQFKVQMQAPTIIDTAERQHFSGGKCAGKSKGNMRKVGSRDHKYSGK